MSAIAISGIAFVLICASTILAMMLRSALPEHHLGSDSKEVIRLATAMIATLAAIVLGMLISSTRSSYEQASGYVDRLTAGIVELDVRLDEYGPEARPLRKLVRDTLGPLADSIWRGNAGPSDRAVPFQFAARGEVVLRGVQELSPQSAVQSSLHSRALQIGADLAQTRLLIFSQRGSSLSTAFLSVLVLWVMVIFGSFGIFTRPNTTVVVVLLVCALSVSSAIFLILEMGQPFEGLLQISSGPLRNALAPL